MIDAIWPRDFHHFYSESEIPAKPTDINPGDNPGLFGVAS
jgi:hypothetical protein